MDAGLRRVNPFRKEGVTKPRPTFYIPPYIEKAVLEGKSHTFVSCGGVHVAWKRTRWIKLVSGRNVQARSLFVLMSMQGEIVGAMHFIETRNGLTRYMRMDEFFDTCDEKSQEKCDHASAAWAALQQDECLEPDEVILTPHQSFVEIAMLHISEAIKGRRLWSNVINELLHTAYRGPDYSIMLLKAFPLEYSPNDGCADDGGDDTLCDRRKSAMARMYAKELGVEVIFGVKDCGIWMYKNLNI
jgi:hypothetical protein